VRVSAKREIQTYVCTTINDQTIRTHDQTIPMPMESVPVAVDRLQYVLFVITQKAELGGS
jgi:hypothetical protein